MAQLKSSFLEQALGHVQPPEKEGLTGVDESTSEEDPTFLQDATLPSKPWPLKWIGWLEIGQVTYIPALEGLRGVALLGVLLDHSLTLTPLSGFLGAMGVTVFFTLSGFLITGVLITHQTLPAASAAHSQTTRKTFAHLPGFWMDRVVRLQPALLTCMAVNLIAVAYVVGSAATTGYLLADLRAILNLMNTPYWRDGVPNEGEGDFPHTWSLACEEQFYVFWCAVMVPLTGCLQHPRASVHRIPSVMCAALMLTSFYLAWYDGMYGSRWWACYYARGPLASFWKMLLGALLRIYGFPRAASGRATAWIGLAIIACAVFAAFCINSDPKHLASLCLNLTAALATLLVIAGSLYNGNALLESHLTRFVGRISYAGYLWTTMVISSRSSWATGWNAYGDTCIGLLCAVASTFWIEEPIRNAYKRSKQNKNAQSASYIHPYA